MKTQLQLIKRKLLKDGFISRNWCLRNYISRLSGIIFRLHEEGIKTVGGYVKTKKGRDYCYYLSK